jgi:hypothetical protein
MAKTSEVQERKGKQDDLVTDDRGQTQPATKRQAQRNSGEVQKNQPPQSPGEPAGGE